MVRLARGNRSTLAHVGLNGLKLFARGVWNGFPDFHVQITDAIGEEDRDVKCWVERGTQQGVFAGIPATGKQVEFEGVSVYRFADNRTSARCQDSPAARCGRGFFAVSCPQDLSLGQGVWRHATGFSAS